MSRLGRKPLESYESMKNNDHGSLNGNHVRDSDRVLRSQGSKDRSQSSPQQASPTRTSGKPQLYPNIEADFKKTTYGLYPDLNNTSLRSATEDELDFSLNDTDNCQPTSPVPPPRRLKTSKEPKVIPNQTPCFQPEKEPTPMESGSNKRYWLIALFICLLAAVVGLCLWTFTTSPDPNIKILQDFEARFKTFAKDYKDEFHEDSLKVLSSALEHHVEMSTDKNQRYPTCVLLAGDERSSGMQNYLADQIANLMPKKKQKSGENVHLVDLADKSVDPGNPNQEDLRSRVHNGINKSLKEGANVFVFRNLDALAPEDVPLLNLFYSYCDGENPTFPKTLWILTMATKGLESFDSPERANFREFHRNAGKAVERYLGHFLENTPQQNEEAHSGVNPLLTRIANYIIPVVPTGRPVPNSKETRPV